MRVALGGRRKKEGRAEEEGEQEGRQAGRRNLARVQHPELGRSQKMEDTDP